MPGHVAQVMRCKTIATIGAHFENLKGDCCTTDHYLAKLSMHRHIEGGKRADTVGEMFLFC